MKKFLICLCVLVICSVVWAEDKKAAEPEKEKPDYRSVIVDAWLVEIDAEALYKSGVKPLSEKDKENVSVMNLLWCLNEPNSGEVIVSARTQAAINEDGQTSFRGTEYFKRMRGEIVEFKAYSSEIDFGTKCWILEDKKHLWMEYRFKSDTFDEDEEEKSEMPPDSIRMESSSVVCIVSGKAVIVAQTQVGDDILFLVLRAEIVE